MWYPVSTTAKESMGILKHISFIIFIFFLFQIPVYTTDVKYSYTFVDVACLLFKLK